MLFVYDTIYDIMQGNERCSKIIASLQGIISRKPDCYGQATMDSLGGLTWK
jgi:hypothetical protein